MHNHGIQGMDETVELDHEVFLPLHIPSAA